MGAFVRSDRRLPRAGLALVLVLGSACATQREFDERTQIRKQAHARFNLGVDHLNHDRTAPALREFLAAIELEPNDPRIQQGLARAYWRQGRPELAVQHLERALTLKPDMHSARLTLSGIYIQLQRYEDAALAAQQLVDDPTFARSWRALTNRGWAEFRLGRIDEARESLALAMRYDNTYWKATLNLGILENKEGRRLEAIALFRRMLDQQPPPPPLAEAEANYRLAEIYIALGQQQRAVEHLTAAAARQPSGMWGERSEKYLRLLR